MKRLMSLPLLERLRLLSLALAAIALCIGYAWNDQWVWALLFLALGGAGWVLPKRLARPLGPPLFTVFAAAAGLGAANLLPTPAMLLAILAALAYWDLDAFQERLKRVPASEDTRRLEELHLKRLAWVLGLGLALSLPGLLLHIKINLLWAMLLALLIIFGIRQGIGFLRQNHEKL